MNKVHNIYKSIGDFKYVDIEAAVIMLHALGKEQKLYFHHQIGYISYHLSCVLFLHKPRVIFCFIRCRLKMNSTNDAEIDKSQHK